MKKIIFTLALLLTLTSCVRVHKMDIEQGNVMTPDMISQLHKGMSQDQVEEVMGTPLLVNTFNDSRKEYIYTFKPGYGDLQGKTLTLTFKNGVLKEMTNSP